MIKEKEVKEIVITGGPGSGKTTFLPYAQKALEKKGIRAFLVDEYATKYIIGGIPDISKIAENDFKRYVGVERQLLRSHLADRKNFGDMAKVFLGERRVKLLDRGGMDVKAYLSANIFNAILEDERLDLWDVRDSYDAVIYLRSAASGAERHYTTANNPARLEKGLRAAREADERTLLAWIGHPHLKIIESCENFEKKKKRALQAILNVVGDPDQVEIERRFLLKCEPDLCLKHFSDERCAKVSIEQMYLRGGGRIRKMGQNGYNAYYMTKKAGVSGAGKLAHVEKECGVSALDYIYLSEKRKPGAKIIKKDRYYFVWENQYLELDIFLEPKKLCILERELIEENDKIKLPPFLEIKKEVTGKPKYSNHGIARGL